MKQIAVWTIIPVLMLIASGCTLKGTVKQITDTTSNITGTTSGHAWWSEDGLLLPEHKAIAFSKYNEANLEQDLARGQGEYVTSLATLLGVPRDQQLVFHAKAQGAFDTLTTPDHEAQIHRLRTLTH
ncbi:MAG: DUF3015 domain-containing protein [Nitrospira sp.]|nr:DUF3015 domain-containing protein [Nitrospira sp.]